MFSNSEEKSSGKQIDMTIHQAVLDNNLDEVLRILKDNKDCLLESGKATHRRNGVEYEGTPLELAIASMNSEISNVLFDELIKIPDGKSHIWKQSSILFSDASIYEKECDEDYIASKKVRDALYNWHYSNEERSQKTFQEQLANFEKLLRRKRKSGFHSNLRTLENRCIYSSDYYRAASSNSNANEQSKKVYALLEKYLPEYYDDARLMTYGKKQDVIDGDTYQYAIAHFIDPKKAEMNDFKKMRAAFCNPEPNFAYTNYSAHLSLKFMHWIWVDHAKDFDMFSAIILTVAFIPVAAVVTLTIGALQAINVGVQETYQTGLRLFGCKKKMESDAALNNDIEPSSIMKRPVGA